MSLVADVSLDSFRLGLLGFACSPAIRDDNQAVGEDGTGNYGRWHPHVSGDLTH